MKISLILLFVLSVNFSFSQEKYTKPRPEKKDKRIMNVTKNSVLDVTKYSRLFFESENQIRARINKQGELKMWSKEEKERTNSIIPEGGIVSFLLYRSTLQASNLKMLTVVIKDSSNVEVFREQGLDKFGEYHYTSMTQWYSNEFTIMLNERYTYPLYIYLIDEGLQMRFEYILLQDDPIIEMSLDNE